MAIKIVKLIVPTAKYPIKCPYKMTPQFVVVHNTANDATARGEISYMTSNDKETSFHFAVDDKEIVQGVYEGRNAWHAGDGREGKGNRFGIAVEICYSKSGGTKFKKAEKNAAKLIADILKRHKWGIAKVTRHKDYSGKDCPHLTMQLGWDRFLKMIKAEMKPTTPTTPVPPTVPTPPVVPQPPVEDWKKKYDDLYNKVNDPMTGYIKQLNDRDEASKNKTQMIRDLNAQLARYERFSFLINLLESMFPVKKD